MSDCNHETSLPRTRTWRVDITKIGVECPRCLSRYQVDASQVGQQSCCKKCDTTFLIEPAQYDEATQPWLAPDRSVGQSPQRAGVDEESVPAVWNVGDVILDLYEVTGELGAGGMGKVLKVHHTGWNLDLAVKSPLPELMQKPRAVENFERECETWVSLGLHPHTVSCYYVRRLGGIPRVFAEFVAGGDLKRWIKDGRLYQGGPTESLKRLLDISIQFAWGLQYAHAQGLIHQDVKPANVLMRADGTAKVTDFGLAKARAAAGEPVATNVSPSRESILVSAGGLTPAYCSPEQAAGKPLSRKTDIWSWAASVLEMFTGDVTWPSGSVAHEALEAYLEVGTGDERLPAMPPGVAVLLRKCLTRDPASRPNDMAEAAAVLQEVYREAIGEAYPREQPTLAKANAASFNNRALSLLDLGQETRAEELWDEALRIEPHHPEATYNRGICQWRQVRMTDVALIRELEQVRRSHPDRWIPDYLLALVHLEQGECERAIELLEKCQRAGGDRPEVAAAHNLAQRILLSQAPACDPSENIFCF